jgi:hypothetical protein
MVQDHRWWHKLHSHTHTQYTYNFASHRTILSRFAVAIPQLTMLFIVNMTSSVCVSVTLRCICVTIVAVAKQKVCVYVHVHACMLILVIQHEMCMRHIILSSVACLAVQYFSTWFHKGHDSQGKKNPLNIKCVFWFSLQLLSERFFILGTVQQDIIIHIHMSSCEIPVIFARFESNLYFLGEF